MQKQKKNKIKEKYGDKAFSKLLKDEGRLLFGVYQHVQTEEKQKDGADKEKEKEEQEKKAKEKDKEKASNGVRGGARVYKYSPAERDRLKEALALLRQEKRERMEGSFVITNPPRDRKVEPQHLMLTIYPPYSLPSIQESGMPLSIRKKIYSLSLSLSLSLSVQNQRP